MRWNSIKIISARLFSVWGLGMLFSGAVFVLLAGTALPSAGISRIFKEKKEFAQPLLSQGNSLARLLRSSRQRNGSQGRVLNTRSGGDGALQFVFDDIETLFYSLGSDVISSVFASENHFWIDFINSALPVRAGPRFV